MKETGNVFDSSTTLMEIEDLPEGEPDARDEGKVASEGEAEPDYFNPPAPAKGGQARRRAMGVLSVVGGMVFTAVLISAATGMGQSKQSSPAPSEAPSRPASSSVVEERQPAPVLQAPPTTRPRPAALAQHRARDRRRREKAKAAQARRRHRHANSSHKAAPPPPEPEPTYTPEPETYVPTETAAPPPPSASAGGSQGEFGFEP